MKKILSVFLVTVLLATTLFGCSANSENETEGSLESASESNTHASSDNAENSFDENDVGDSEETDKSDLENDKGTEKKPATTITTFTRSGNYILFGEFPQTLKAASVKVSTKTDSRGYFLGDDGEYYAKVVASPCGKDYKFSTRATVNEGETYYFKVEPIKWAVISEKDGVATLLCSSAIAAMQCDANSNNYKDSDVRKWLGNKFYSVAFSSTQKPLIEEVTVDNSAASTGISSNQYACENTVEKVFLLSYKESLSADYGFNTSNTAADKVRQKNVTDYAKATGAYASDSGNAIWWLRSPSDNRKFNEMNSRSVSEEGTVIDLYSLVDYACVVPALKLKTK